MKKVMFMLFLALSIFSFSKTYTTNEKKELLKQFEQFQKALNTGVPSAIEKYVQFPVSGISKEEFMLYNYETLSHIGELKVNTSKLEINPINSKLLYDSTYMNAYGYFISKSDSKTSYIYDLITTYSGNGLLVVITEEDEEIEGSMYLIFDLIKGQLKLTNILYLP